MSGKKEDPGRGQLINDREPERTGPAGLAGRIKAAIRALLDRYRDFVGRK